MKIECLKIDRITDDFPQLVDFAGYCGMEEDVVVVAPRKELEVKLKNSKARRRHKRMSRI